MKQKITAAPMVARVYLRVSTDAQDLELLCQVGLPRAKVEGREFMRQSGAAWVNVQAG